jgi:acyl transferase domain-containing protein/thioesterase domain-containing protein
MPGTSIAIVGMAGRFPGANDLRQFWNNLRNGVESIRRLTDDELLAAGVRPEDIANPDYVKAAPILDGVDQFDAPFFGFSPRDAAIMDPQHRHFLECTWEALENAGHPPNQFPGSIAVFAGSGMNTYLIYNLLTNRKLMESAGLFLLKQTGNDKDVLATRVSYQLNLRGPSINVQTACSTSLVAVHLASQSLLNYECDMALAGGVTIEFPHGHGYMYRDGEILSRDGHCRSFDASSSGTIFSSGAGVVVLRRLEDAIADRDTIHAVILSSAINNDGARKVGFLAPSVEGQAEVISEAIGVAGIFADAISYVETHGTGTVVGDPIEIKALTKAFRATTLRKDFCAIGSLKSNIGHLDAAAGVAGLIKTTLALENKQIPASLHFEKPNPMIDFAGSPFFVNAKTSDWPTVNAPRRAGVTSLGIGGTNAHVILEEAPLPPAAHGAKPFQLLTVSARTETALRNLCDNLASHLAENPSLRLSDAAFTLQAGRKEFPVRRAFIASDNEQAARVLRGEEPRNAIALKTVGDSPQAVFLFSGQGSQYVRMCRGLYDSEPAFRENLDRCSALLLPVLQLDLRQVLFPEPGKSEDAKQQLNQTWLTQPALFSVEYSLAQWWKSVGVTPKSMLGHSIGEYVAACIAGVFNLEDALAVTALRGRLMQDLPGGAMLAVPVSPDEFAVPSGLCLAAVNSPDQCVVSGPFDLIDQFEKTLANRGITGRRLHTSHAFHSSMMDPILETFTDRLRNLRLRAPQIPFLSNVTADWITPEQATDPAYWAKHLRSTVRFADCLAKLYERPNSVLMEVGPGNVLTSLARQHPARTATVIPSTRPVHDSLHDSAILLSAVGQLWVHGHSVKWKALHNGETVGRVPLPTYPFDRQRYWIDGGESIVINSSPRASSAAAKVEDAYIYRRGWTREERPAATPSSSNSYMLFSDDSSLSRALRQTLLSAGQSVVEVLAGEKYARLSATSYSIRDSVAEDYRALISELSSNGGQLPEQIFHLWPADDVAESIPAELDRSFYSLLYLAQALGDHDVSGVGIHVVTAGLHSVAGEECSHPERAALLGPVRVISKELPGIRCRNIDLARSYNAAEAAPQIVEEAASASVSPVVAYRDSGRWIESFQSAATSDSASGIKLREKGVYLITGGVGGIGLLVAERLAKQCKANLVLLGRSKFPPESDWKRLAEDSSTAKPLRQKLAKLSEIRALGSEVLVLSADVVAPASIERAAAIAESRFGKINGIVHAAGSIQDRPLQLKTSESAASVLAPKIFGTLALHEFFLANKMDFFALVSSVSAVFPPAGQIDYAAANSFLDSFANWARDPRVFSTNWGLWQNVGMGAPFKPLHPLLDRTVVETQSEAVYAGDFSLDTHWLVSEHIFRSGKALVPGTGYLELALAAFLRDAQSSPLESPVQFDDVFFLSPLVCAPREKKEVRVRLSRDRAFRNRFRFSILGARDSKNWTEHCSGQISRSDAKRPSPIQISLITDRCSSNKITFDDQHRTRQERFFNFGPRWHNLRTLRLGKNEGLAELELDASFAGDLPSYLIHPALLDLATGCALYLVRDYNNSDAVYLPLTYRRIRVFQSLPRKIYSHIRIIQPSSAKAEVATFGITITDERGNVLVVIEDFAMRRIVNFAAIESSLPQESSEPSLTSSFDEQPAQTQRSGLPAELATQTFFRILTAPIPSGFLVLPQPVESYVELPTAPRAAESSTAEDTGHVESLLADWWRELLGVGAVGLDDDFFDLGGHSLIAVRLVSKIKKAYKVDFGLSVMFEARTIRQLADLIRRTSAPNGAVSVTPSVDAWTPIVTIQPKGTRAPLFLISGLGGNVLNFENLARHLGEDQPVFALQPQGLDGKRPFHTRVEDMASFYLAEIRKRVPHGVFHLAGYSFGGFVAFEMAQQLLAAGEPVGMIGLLDTLEWHYLEQIRENLDLRARLTLYKSRFDEFLFGGDPWGYLKGRLGQRSKQFLYRAYKFVGRSLPQTFGTVQDINSFAAANYVPRFFSRKVTIFRSAVRSFLEGNDELLGWRELAQSLEVYDVPGSHHDITREPNVRVLAEKMREALARVATESSNDSQVDPSSGDAQALSAQSV